ncbi:MAG: hypothetical protein ACOYL6_19395, partial [Bacteriovoracaceae bacterium]
NEGTYWANNGQVSINYLSEACNTKSSEALSYYLTNDILTLHSTNGSLLDFKKQQSIAFIEKRINSYPEEKECTLLSEISNELKPIYQGCCKICTTGKACGDSCISSSYQCTKGAGCACDG